MGVPKIGIVSETSPSSTNKVDDEDYQRNHKQQVNQGTRNVQAESQKPKDQQDDKNCPEHIHPSSALSTPKIRNLPGARNAFNSVC
jgi:hypothetical protein